MATLQVRRRWTDFSQSRKTSGILTKKEKNKMRLMSTLPNLHRRVTTDAGRQLTLSE